MCLSIVQSGFMKVLIFSDIHNDLAALRHLNGILTDLADAVDRLPKRTLSLTQRLADEERIQKGI